MADEHVDGAEQAQPRPRPRWENWLIAGFLAYQVVTPLTYYFGDRVYDERFAWRMFSTTRLARCDIAVTEGEAPSPTRPVDLNSTLQIAWFQLMRRYRPAVVRQFLRDRCSADPTVQAVRFRRTCIDTDGSALPGQEVLLTCRDGRFDVTEGEP